jgi:hypothetical protein
MNLEPRVRIGISICGCPDYISLIEHRAQHLGIQHASASSPPYVYIPDSLRALVRAHGVVSAPPGVFAGKRVLVVAGGEDMLVPWAVSRAFVEALDVGMGGRKEVVVVPGVQHEFTDGMKEEVFKFFWEEALV